MSRKNLFFSREIAYLFGWYLSVVIFFSLGFCICGKATTPLYLFNKRRAGLWHLSARQVFWNFYNGATMIPVNEPQSISLTLIRYSLKLLILTLSMSTFAIITTGHPLTNLLNEAGKRVTREWDRYHKMEQFVCDIDKTEEFYEPEIFEFIQKKDGK